MIRFFKKKPRKKFPPQLLDMDGVPIQEGDEVISHRYELGRCNVTLEALHYFYLSKENEKKVSYTKMIDAITGNQKVKKVS